MRWRVLFVVASLGLGACGGSDPDPTPAVCMDPPTYAVDIAPLVARACIRCHDSEKVNMARQGAPPGVDFDTYETIPDKDAFADAVTSGREPPPGATPPIEVSSEDRALVNNWRRCGYKP